MSNVARALVVVVLTLAAAGCISAPAPKYQASIANSELLLQQNAKLSVGKFDAAAGVSNRSLSVRGSELAGGSDGTFATYLRDAIVSELQASARYDERSDARLSGVLTHNEINAGLKTGSAAVGAEFVLTRADKECFKKAFVAEHEWDSSFVGAVAIPAAIDNYPTAVQQLLGKLFADPDFKAALSAR